MYMLECNAGHIKTSHQPHFSWPADEKIYTGNLNVNEWTSQRIYIYENSWDSYTLSISWGHIWAHILFIVSGIYLIQLAFKCRKSHTNFFADDITKARERDGGREGERERIQNARTLQTKDFIEVVAYPYPQQ